MTKKAHQRIVDANRANATADFQQTGSIMANIRTSNRRHKRTIVAQLARDKAAEKAPAATVKPVKAAR